MVSLYVYGREIHYIFYFILPKTSNVDKKGTDAVSNEWGLM
jgi:hypothetical protein